MWMLIAIRLLGGAMQANAAVANAYVADITAPEDRAKRFGCSVRCSASGSSSGR